MRSAILFAVFKTQAHELVTYLQREVDADALNAYRHYLDSHPDKFAAFPSLIGNKVCNSGLLIEFLFTSIIRHSSTL